MGLGGGWGLSGVKLTNITMASEQPQIKRFTPDYTATEKDSETEMYLTSKSWPRFPCDAIGQ